MHYWILKSDPDAFSWGDMIREGQTSWDGVRNYQARNYLRQMRPGDEALFYHSGSAREVLGIVRVISDPYPDPTTADHGWTAVRVEALRSLPRPVSLAAIKAETALAKVGLVRQPRLSVIPLTQAEFENILKL